MLPYIYIYIDLYTYTYKYEYVYVYHVLNALPLSFHGHTSQYLPAFACKGNKTLTNKQKKKSASSTLKKKSQLPVPRILKKKRDSALVYSLKKAPLECPLFFFL